MNDYEALRAKNFELLQALGKQAEEHAAKVDDLEEIALAISRDRNVLKAKVEELTNKLKGAQATAAGYGLCIGLKKMGRDSFIRKAVDRFLCWKLPKGFAPDAGISFIENRSPLCWPIGTNLFDAEQARQMFEDCIPEDSVIMHKVEEQLDAMTKERDALNGVVRDDYVELKGLQAEAAAKDAVIERLREALMKCTANIGRMLRDGEWYTPEEALEAATEALAISNDDSALQERLSAERERCAKVCEECDTNHVYTNGSIKCAKALRSMT